MALVLLGDVGFEGDVEGDGDGEDDGESDEVWRTHSSKRIIISTLGKEESRVTTER